VDTVVAVVVVVVYADTERRRGAAVLELSLETPALEKWQTPAALFALAINVLATHSPPE
jgi:hypothetical protein